MKYDFHLLMFFVGVGLLFRKISWKGWFALCLVILTWLMYNWKYV